MERDDACRMEPVLGRGTTRAPSGDVRPTGDTHERIARGVLFGGDADRAQGAQLIVPRKLLARSPDALPAVVDHRLEGTEGPTRDQGIAPACTAFATATALDHALLRWGAPHTAVNVMQIWSRYHSPRVETSLTSNLGQPVGAEPTWPFNATEAVSWVPCAE